MLVSRTRSSGPAHERRRRRSCRRRPPGSRTASPQPPAPTAPAPRPAAPRAWTRRSRRARSRSSAARAAASSSAFRWPTAPRAAARIRRDPDALAAGETSCGLELPRQVARPVHGTRQPVARAHRQDRCGVRQDGGRDDQREGGEGIRLRDPWVNSRTSRWSSVDSRQSGVSGAASRSIISGTVSSPIMPTIDTPRRVAPLFPQRQTDRRSCSSRASASSATAGRRRSMACADRSRWCRSTIAASARANRDGRLTIDDMAADALAIHGR